MRIGFDLHGLHDLFQGSRTYACNTAKALLAADASNAYNLYLPEPNDPEVRREFGRGNTRLLPIPASRRARLVWPFPQTLGRDGVDVLHCHYMGPLFCPVPYVVSIHDIIHETNPEFFPGGMRRLMRLLYPRSARRAAMVLTISEYSKRQIMTHYNIPEERIAFRHCGVSEEFRVLEDRRAVDAVKAKYGIRTPYVLFVGRIEPRKNLPRLIEAFLRISGGFPHTLVAAGMMDEIFKPFYEAVVKEKGRDRVLFTGRVEQEDLPALYNGADLFAYPSHAEGFGLPVLEAMACGTPVLTSNTTSLPEVAGDAGLLVSPTDAEGIAKAMADVLSDAALRATLSRRGPERAARFRWEDTAALCLEAYETVKRRVQNGPFP